MYRPTHTYSSPRPTSSNSGQPAQYDYTNGEVQANLSQRSAAVNPGQKPFIPSYRLFEDLDVFGNADGRYRPASTASSGLSGSSSQNMVGGRK